MEIHRADAGARRKALMIVVLGAAAGIAAVLAIDALRPDLEPSVRADSAAVMFRMRAVMVVLCVSIVVPVIGFAVYLWRMSGHVDGARRYPPPGARLLRDVPVLTGDAARRRARVLRGLAGALAVIACVTAGLLIRLAVVL